jgi:uncharacterized protein YdbL (DUF1318 family)
MMTDKKKDKTRRKFLGIGLAVGASLVTDTAFAQVINEATKGEPVKMLTPDGKLVEVDPDVLAQAIRKKVNNKEILDWSQTAKDKKGQ